MTTQIGQTIKTLRKSKGVGKICSACNGSGKSLDGIFEHIMTFGLLWFFKGERCTLCKGSGIFVTTDLKDC